MSAAATPRRTSTRRSTSGQAAIPSSSRSSRAKSGAGVTLIRSPSNRCNLRALGFMHAVEVLLGLLATVAVLATFAGKIGVPYPILQVLGGVALGFLPGLPHVEVPPDVVFLLFLPPLIYASAFFSAIRDMRGNAPPISILAIGLVLTTMVVVAAVAHAVIHGLSWPIAFVLGAVVAPPDALAVSAIAQRLDLPRRI